MYCSVVKKKVHTEQEHGNRQDSGASIFNDEPEKKRKKITKLFLFIFLLQKIAVPKLLW